MPTPPCSALEGPSCTKTVSKEKSHYCLAKYLEEEYAKKGKVDPETITMLNAFREERHAIMYGFEEIEVGKGEAREAVSAAEKFIRKAEELLAPE